MQQSEARNREIATICKVACTEGPVIPISDTKMNFKFDFQLLNNQLFMTSFLLNLNLQLP